MPAGTADKVAPALKPDEVEDQFDAIILDQWGVLHVGTAPYPGAVDALTSLARNGVRFGVLSNSGKRADLNRDRIARIGFGPDLFDCVMTLGEALWQDAIGLLCGKRAYAVAAKPDDADNWAQRPNMTFVEDLAEAEIVLIMGLPEGDLAPSQADLDRLRDAITAQALPVFCSNPDRKSPPRKRGIGGLTRRIGPCHSGGGRRCDVLRQATYPRLSRG
ncbi:hypothetical protein [Pseudooctadecabacter sp.]|uniref:hypothetical protein n=1 Tax=Pseudooctadecabacter sp. TaxID=1966338 RepID=UPI003F6B4832